MKKIDLHVHTNYSFDCNCTMQDQIKSAIDKNVGVICFCDHVENSRLCNTLDGFPFLKRQDEFFNLREKYKKDILVLLGFELGEPSRHKEYYTALRGLHCDMLIGSCHFALDKYFWSKEVEDSFVTCKEHNQDVAEILLGGDFDVLGHADLPKRYFWGVNYFEDEEKIKDNMRLCVEKGIVPEINCSPLKRGVPQPCPSLKYIQNYVNCGGKYVTISSDAHKSCDVAQFYDEIFEQLPKEIKLCYFQNRKLVPFLD